MTTLSAAQIAQYAYQAGFRNTAAGQDLTLAVAVALAESGGQTNATHRNSDSRKTTDYGVWQINSYWHRDLIARGNWSDPAYNAKMAFIIKTTRGGWTQWSTFNSGSFFKHMPAAIKAAEAVQNGQPDTVVNPPNATLPATDMDGDGNGLEDAVKKITDPHTYIRLAMAVTGALLLLLGLVMLGWNNAPQSVKTVAKAVVTKKVPLK